MNQQESSVMAELLSSSEFRICNSIEDAEIVILETCAIRKKAEDKVYSLLGRLKQLRKKSGLPKKIVVCGCMVTEDGAKNLVEEHGVSVVLGPRRISRIAEALHESETEPVIDISFVWALPPYDISAPYISGVSAYATVMQGCSNSCSYCVVPSRRGAAQSKPLRQIIDEIKLLETKGYKEVILLGQNISYFGIDKPDTPRLIDLLEIIESESRISRIRFVTSHPAFIDDKFIERLSKLRRVMPNIHLPIQSGSNRILKAMRRGYSSERFLELVRAFRNGNENFTINTDFIAGYDGETPADHCETLELIEKAELDGAYAFPYSERNGTRAALTNNENSIPIIERKKRCKEILDKVKKVALERRKRDIGRSVEVLIEAPGVGRSEGNINVEFEGGRSNEFGIVKIKEVSSFAMCGELEDNCLQEDGIEK